MENLSDVQLKRCIAWMRLEFLAWICLCTDALESDGTWTQIFLGQPWKLYGAQRHTGFLGAGAVHRNFVCMEQYLYAGGIRTGAAPKKKERRILRK